MTNIVLEFPALTTSRFKPLESIILYSDGGTHASQAWILLKARGLKYVYTLRGGLNFWNDMVLHPILPIDAPAEARDSAARMAAFFGGRIEEAASTARSPVPDHRHTPKPVGFQREPERIRDGC